MTHLKLASSTALIKLGSTTATFQKYTQQEIIPGNGPVGFMPVEEQIGTPESFGYTSTPIAHWNMIPLEDISSDPRIGIIAFGINEVDRVELSVNGSSWFPITEMTENTRTGCWEYHATINTTTCTPGEQLEIRGRVYPRSAGVSFNLPILTVNYGSSSSSIFYCSPHGNDITGDGTELNPYLTVGQVLTRLSSDAGASIYNADNITVILKGNNDGSTPAEYTITHPSSNHPLVNNSWFTVSGDPAVNRELIRIKDSNTGGVRARNIKYKHLTFWQQGVCAAQLKTPQGLPSQPNVWCEDTYHTDSIRYNDNPATAQNVITSSAFTDVYFSGCSCYKNQDGFKLFTIARNCIADELAEDCFGGAKLGVNLTATNQKLIGSFHPDLFEAYEIPEPVIYFNCIGLNAQGQGIYIGEATNVANIAYVNIICETPGGTGDFFGDPPTSQIRNSDLLSGDSYSMSNVLLDSVTLPARSLVLSSDDTLNHTIENVVIRNSVFWNISGGTDTRSKVVLKNSKSVGSGTSTFSNLFNINNTSGLSYTLPGGIISTNTADTMWTYSNIEDFRPNSSSVLGTAIKTVPVDATLAIRRNSTSIGALESSS